MERVAPVTRDVDSEALLDQTSPDEAGHRAVVFHEEDPHEISHAIPRRRHRGGHLGGGCLGIVTPFSSRFSVRSDPPWVSSKLDPGRSAEARLRRLRKASTDGRSPACRPHSPDALVGLSRFGTDACRTPSTCLPRGIGGGCRHQSHTKRVTSNKTEKTLPHSGNEQQKLYSQRLVCQEGFPHLHPAYILFAVWRSKVVTVYRPLVGASDLKWHLRVVEWGRGGEYALGRGAAGQDRSAGRGTGQAGPRAGGQGPAHRGTRANHRGVGAAWEAASGPVLEGHAILGSEATRPQAG